MVITDAKTTLGRAIRSLREAAGISQEKLADKANFDRAFLMRH